MWIFEEQRNLRLKIIHKVDHSLNNEYIRKEKKKISLSIGDIRSQNELC